MSRGDVLADTVIALCPGHGIDLAQNGCLISLLSMNGCFKVIFMSFGSGNISLITFYGRQNYVPCSRCL